MPHLYRDDDGIGSKSRSAHTSLFKLKQSRKEISSIIAAGAAERRSCLCAANCMTESGPKRPFSDSVPPPAQDIFAALWINPLPGGTSLGVGQSEYPDGVIP